MDWKLREAELLRRNAELDRKGEAAVEQFESVVRQQEERMKSRYADLEDSLQDEPPLEHEPHAEIDPIDEPEGPTFLTGVKNSARYTNKHSKTVARRLRRPPGVEPESNALKMEAELAPTGISMQATVRLQKARLMALEKALSKLSSENLEFSSRVKDLSHKLEEVTEQNKQLKRSLQSRESLIAKSKKSISESQNKSKGYQRELQVAKKELATVQKERNNLQTNSKNLDLKLTRALTEVDKLKSRMKSQKSSGKMTGDVTRKELSKAQGDVRRLQTHNRELIAAFKKQMKLIDVLKRQKMHMEAAKMLSFTEEEFAKSISFRGEK